MRITILPNLKFVRSKADGLRLTDVPSSLHSRKVISSYTRHMSQSTPRFSLFLRALGFKRGFRRTGVSTLPNVAVAAFVGVVSGHYIFNEPLREYFAELKEREEQEKKATVENSEQSSA